MRSKVDRLSTPHGCKHARNGPMLAEQNANSAWLLFVCLMVPAGPACATKAYHNDLCVTTMPFALPTTTARGALKVPPDLPVGSAIPGARIALSITMTCKSGSFDASNNIVNFVMFPGNTLTSVPGLKNVYGFEGGPAGIGIRFLNQSEEAVPVAAVTTDGCTHRQAILLASGTNATTQFAVNGAFEFVKTGGVTAGSKSILFKPTVCAQVWGNKNSTQSAWTVVATVEHASVTTCTVLNALIPVSMPNIAAGKLASVGSASSPTLFSIDLNCNAGATLYATLTDSSKPGNGGTLLTPTPDSTAKGLALQISREDGTLVSYGADSATAGNAGQFKIGATVDGVMKIPLKASYIRTENIVRGGTLMGKATFTLSYQ